MKKTIFLTIALFIPLSIFGQIPSTTQNQTALAEPSAVTTQTNDRSIEDQSVARLALIESIARSLKFSDPKMAFKLVPGNAVEAEEITLILRRAVSESPDLTQELNFCNKNFDGGLIGFNQTAELALDDLLYQIHNRFGINFLMGSNIANLPINIRSGKLPWSTLLRSQLFLSGIRATCIGDKTIQLIKNADLQGLQDNQEVTTKFIKLKFLQPTTGGNVDLAGRSSGQGGGGGQGGQGCQGGGAQGGGAQGGGGQTGGCGNFEKLLVEIQKILGISSGSGGGIGGGSSQSTTEPKKSNRSVSQIPGRNILVVRASEEELELINQIISRADRAPFQVVIKGLVYTANENRLRDIGVQMSAVVGTGDLSSLGGVTSQPSTTSTTTTGSSGQTVPGGVRTLGPGFAQPASGGSVFGFSAIVGTAQFSAQAIALEQNGVISVKNRPFAVVLDGDPTALDVGRSIPILTFGSSVNGGQSGNLEILKASNVLSVTPHVIDDDNGNPVAVNLELQIESNEVDTAVVSQGIPSINRRSIQSRLILNQDKTVILGGFTIDSDSKTVTKTPGLGDIPILGELFKRRVNTKQVSRLYFAISVEVIPYGSVIEPVKVPGATTDVPTIAPEMLKPLGKGVETSANPGRTNSSGQTVTAAKPNEKEKKP